MSSRDPWLGEGWIRDHGKKVLHRVPGELHRAPDGLSGWTDSNLAVLLRDYVNDDESRHTQLDKARTRKQWLTLASEWKIPYITQEEWLRSIDTPEEWFEAERIATPLPIPKVID